MPNLMEALEDVLIATVDGNSSLEINYTVTFSNIGKWFARNTRAGSLIKWYLS